MYTDTKVQKNTIRTNINNPFNNQFKRTIRNKNFYFKTNYYIKIQFNLLRINFYFKY